MKQDRNTAVNKIKIALKSFRPHKIHIEVLDADNKVMVKVLHKLFNLAYSTHTVP